MRGPYLDHQRILMLDKQKTCRNVVDYWNNYFSFKRMN